MQELEFIRQVCIGALGPFAQELWKRVSGKLVDRAEEEISDKLIKPTTKVENSVASAKVAGAVQAELMVDDRHPSDSEWLLATAKVLSPTSWRVLFYLYHSSSARTCDDIRKAVYPQIKSRSTNLIKTLDAEFSYRLMWLSIFFGLIDRNDGPDVTNYSITATGTSLIDRLQQKEHNALFLEEDFAELKEVASGLSRRRRRAD